MKNNKPFFSVVLSIYGVEKYLDRCINSILNQDFDNFELILVDDGSKDNCPAMCDEWSKKDKRIKVIHKENAGLGFARNSGLDAAEGDFIFFIDSDDYILPKLFSSVHEKLVGKQTDIVFYGFNRIDEKGNIRASFVPEPEFEIYNDNDIIKNKLLPDFICGDPKTGINRRIRISAWNCCISVSLLKQSGLRFVSEREYISEDIFFYVELFPYLHSVQFVKQAFYCYCQNEGSLTYKYHKDRYSRIRHFYQAVISKADKLNYDGEVQKRLKVSFTATVMGCLKMEADNYRKIGMKEAYKRIKNICKDDYLIESLSVSSFDKYKKSWRLFKYCVMHKRYMTLTFIMIMQYKIKGI